MEETRFQRGWELLKQVDDAGGETVISSLADIAPERIQVELVQPDGFVPLETLATSTPGRGCPFRSGSW